MRSIKKAVLQYFLSVVIKLTVFNGCLYEDQVKDSSATVGGDNLLILKIESHLRKCKNYYEVNTVFSPQQERILENFYRTTSIFYDLSSKQTRLSAYQMVVTNNIRCRES